MKTLYKSIFLFAAASFMVACDTEIENIGYEPEHYVDYTALREYKNSDHEITFGWFGGWNGGGASASSSLKGLPDSVDMVSIWGKWYPLDEKKAADMKYVQEVKGTKVLACIFTPRIGADLTPEGETAESYWGWDTSDADKQEAATRKYGKAIAEAVVNLGYSGLDIDNEPEKSSIYGDTRLFTAFVEEVGKYLQEHGKVFCIDGYLTTGLKPHIVKYVTYFISQAYYCSSYSNLDSRFNEIVRFYANEETGETRESMARRFIVTEDFERHAADGGPSHTDRDGNKMRSSEGMAVWKPLADDGTTRLQKGGSGLYHIEYDYINTKQEYYYTRRIIQLKNPAK